MLVEGPVLGDVLVVVAAVGVVPPGTVVVAPAPTVVVAVPAPVVAARGGQGTVVVAAVPAPGTVVVAAAPAPGTVVVAAVPAHTFASRAGVLSVTPWSVLAVVDVELVRDSATTAGARSALNVIESDVAISKSTAPSGPF